ncbi:hypothetical protein [Aeromonas schubertii]|uniref:Uncharacterized protein n=1 Tax=Aeromonas schubertii TaxID=652 RepID=A0ABS7VDR6_9GAMM|nr:hypothetical protein [Aeromonas schubertii]MBZ6067116.1 hypothetical protein [Aeromonas schubertii]MBZ6074167.1 hypothetical protein [Aeromonas schubertii]
MKKLITHKPLRRSKPLELPPEEPFAQAILIRFGTASCGGYAIELDGCPGEFSIDDLH